MSRKVTRQPRVSMERIRAAGNSRLMRLAQKMIVAGTLLLDRVANSNLNPEASLCGSYVYSSRRRVGAQELGARCQRHRSHDRGRRKKTKEVALVTDQSTKQPAKSRNKPLFEGNFAKPTCC